MESMVNQRILILGNLGYVGPELTKLLRKTYPKSHLTGFDCGYFSKFYTANLFSPDNFLDVQIYGDVRKCENLDLSNCHNITDVSLLGNVHTLNLSDCNKITDVSALGNVHTLDLSYCHNIIDVSALGNVNSLNLSGCDNITDVSALGNVHIIYANQL